MWFYGCHFEVRTLGSYRSYRRRLQIYSSKIRVMLVIYFSSTWQLSISFNFFGTKFAKKINNFSKNLVVYAKRKFIISNNSIINHFFSLIFFQCYILIANGLANAPKLFRFFSRNPKKN